MIMRCIQKDSQLEGNASKSDARVNQVCIRQKESDATRENGCHFYTRLELDSFRNSMFQWIFLPANSAMRTSSEENYSSRNQKPTENTKINKILNLKLSSYQFAMSKWRLYNFAMIHSELLLSESQVLWKRGALIPGIYFL
jgi:hypothetical protein